MAQGEQIWKKKREKKTELGQEKSTLKGQADEKN